MLDVEVLALSATAALLGCPTFAPGPYYTRPVVSATVDRNSTNYLRSAIEAGNSGGFWIAANPVESVNVASSSTPTYRVRPKVAYHSFETPYPWDANFFIEPLSDAHAIVVRPETCDLYETYNTTFTNGVLWAYSGAHWNLRHPFVPLQAGRPSAMASGLSLYAGMIRWEEVASGSIDHALNWAAPAGTVAAWSFVRPASDTDGIVYNGKSRYWLPYGARLRLRASFDASHFGPQSKVIARAMKTYGMYLADTARENELYNAKPLVAGTSHWDASDLAALASIHLSDFEVLTVGNVEQVPGH
jgi:hypothetical protein